MAAADLTLFAKELCTSLRILASLQEKKPFHAKPLRTQRTKQEKKSFPAFTLDL